MAGDLIVSGLSGSGFDGGAIVQQILQLRSIPIQRLQQEKALVQAKLTSLSDLSGRISDFLGLVENLDIDQLFKNRTVNVGDDGIIDATVTEEAPLLSFSVTVNELASGEIRVSNSGVSSLETGLSSSGTLTLSYDTGSGTETFNINYSAGDTLQDLVDAINSAQSRVKASIYYDGTSYRLMLAESDVSASTVETDTAGATYAISVSGLPSDLGTDLDTLQSAKNAQIVIGSGSAITSPSNTFNDVITGVTITAKAKGTSSLEIREDYSKVTDFFKKFEKNFNSLVESADSLITGESPLFAGEGSIRNVRTGAVDRLDPLIEAGLIDYDGDTGKIKVNTDRLNELLEKDPESVKGLIANIRDSYKSFLEGQRDVFKSFEDTFNTQIERIDERIQSLAQRLQQEERLLRLEFSRLEAFISQANDIRDRLRQFMVSLSEINQGGN